MPTAADFTNAASALRLVVADLAVGRRQLDHVRTSRAVAGGRVASLVDAALAVSQANTDDLARRVEWLAATCDRRARVAAEHAAAILQWQRRNEAWERAVRAHRAALDDPTLLAPHPGPPPTRPVAPYPWVDPR